MTIRQSAGEHRGTAAGALKKKVDIEQLVTWAYLDELSKRQTSSAEGIWDRLQQYGSLGGVNADASRFAGGGAQRYAQFGLPHPDAEVIERAIAAELASFTLDWEREFYRIAAELAALVSINDIGLARPPKPWRPFDPKDNRGESGFDRAQLEIAQMSEFTYTHLTTLGAVEEAGPRRGIRVRRRQQGPRDVLMLNTTNAPALVIMHAVRRTRPQWESEPPLPHGIPAGGGLSAVVGECRGKNLYSAGSYCPLRWEPSPVEIALGRADYVLWHNALTALSQKLNLAEHVALPPAAPAAPWCEQQKPERIWSYAIGEQWRSLLISPRKLAGPRRKKPKHSKVRRPLVDKGAKA